MRLIPRTYGLFRHLFLNSFMRQGKKHIALGFMMRLLSVIKFLVSKNPHVAFFSALNAVRHNFTLKPLRMGRRVNYLPMMVPIRKSFILGISKVKKAVGRIPPQRWAAILLNGIKRKGPVYQQKKLVYNQVVENLSMLSSVYHGKPRFKDKFSLRRT